MLGDLPFGRRFEIREIENTRARSVLRIAGQGNGEILAVTDDLELAP